MCPFLTLISAQVANKCFCDSGFVGDHCQKCMDHVVSVHGIHTSANYTFGQWPVILPLYRNCSGVETDGPCVGLLHISDLPFISKCTDWGLNAIWSVRTLYCQRHVSTAKYVFSSIKYSHLCHRRILFGCLWLETPWLWGWFLGTGLHYLAKR